MDGLLGVAGMITTSVTSDYGSFLHSLLSTSKMLEAYENNGMFTTSKKVQFFFPLYHGFISEYMGINMI